MDSPKNAPHRNRRSSTGSSPCGIAAQAEMDVVQDVHISVNDLWSAGEHVLAFEYALQGMAPEQVLDRFQPDWRERYSSNFETYRAGDGQLSIRAKS